jgi:hypothetical protein
MSRPVSGRMDLSPRNIPPSDRILRLQVDEPGQYPRMLPVPMLFRNQLNALFLLTVFAAGGLFAPVAHRQGHDDVHTHDHPELYLEGGEGRAAAAAAFLVDGLIVSIEPVCLLCARLVFRKYFRQVVSAPDEPSEKLISSAAISHAAAPLARLSIRGPPVAV